MKDFFELKRLIQLLSVFFCLILTGCIPEGYSGQQEKSAKDQAKIKMEAYFAEELPGAKVTSAEVITAFDEEKYERKLTDYVRGTFSYQDKTFDYVADVAQGDIYTSVPIEEVLSRLQGIILERLQIEAKEADVAGYTIRCLKFRKESGLSGVHDFDGVFPAGESVEEIVQEILEDDSAYYICADIQYKGKELPAGIEDRMAPFPSLKVVNIYRVREDSELAVGEEFHADTLSCVSSEILYANYEKNSSRLQRSKVLCADGFRVLYAAYTKTREGDDVAEQTMNEEDILLTVTEDYIELLCEKDTYRLYLFTDGADTENKYLYTRQWRPNKDAQPKFQKGAWRRLGDASVFTDSEYVLVPYAFTQTTASEYYSGNRIYADQK